MSDVTTNISVNIPKGNKPKLETTMGEGYITTFSWRTNLNIKRRLLKIMEDRDHLTFFDTLDELITEEFNRKEMKL